MISLFSTLRIFGLTLALVLLCGCVASFNPRVYPPDGVEDLRLLSRSDWNDRHPGSVWNQGKSDRLDKYSYCKLYREKVQKLDEYLKKPVPDAGVTHELQMDAARTRARCLQQQLARRLDGVEGLEVATRISLFLLGIGATAVGVFDGSDDLVTSLAIAAGLTTGVRGFNPLHARQNLYFSAIGALECSIMTAETVAGQEDSRAFAARAFRLLQDGMAPEANGNGDVSMSPETLAQRPNPSESMREILMKRLYLVRQGKSKSKTANNGLDDHSTDSYAPYLRADSRVFDYLSEFGGSAPGPNLAPTLLELSSDSGRMLRRLDGAFGDAIANLMSSNAAQLTQSNRRLVESVVEALEKARRAVEDAPRDLEHATTLIAMAVNKILVEEQPDAGALTDAARKSMTKFMDDVQVARELSTSMEQQQKPELDAAAQNVEIVLPFVKAEVEGGGNGADKNGNSTFSSLNAYQSALEDIADARSKIIAAIKLVSSQSNYPAACRALINGDPVPGSRDTDSGGA